MKAVIATVLAASALVGATQAFAYEQTTVTTTRTVEAHRAPPVVIVHDDHDDFRHRQWVREQERRRWMESHHEYHEYRGY